MLIELIKKTILFVETLYGAIVITWFQFTIKTELLLWTDKWGNSNWYGNENSDNLAL